MTEAPVSYIANPSSSFKLRPCIFCHQHMIGTSYREFTDERTGLPYVKSGFMCPYCDYWQFYRIPTKLAETIAYRDHFRQPEYGMLDEDQIPAITNVVDIEAQTRLKGVWEIRFTCLICSCPMQSVYRAEEVNERTGQIYVKTRYFCRGCNCWDIIKVPRKLAETVTREHPTA